jgi:hypothetical protein
MSTVPHNTCMWPVCPSAHTCVVTQRTSAALCLNAVVLDIKTEQHVIGLPTLAVRNRSTSGYLRSKLSNPHNATCLNISSNVPFTTRNFKNECHIDECDSHAGARCGPIAILWHFDKNELQSFLRGLVHEKCRGMSGQSVTRATERTSLCVAS